MRPTLVAMSVSLCVASSALAGEAASAPPPPPPPPPAEPPPPPPPALREPAEAPPPQVDRSNDDRFRWGVGAQLGWFIPQPMFTFGAEGRFGWSVNRLFSAYLQLGAGGGLYFGVSAGQGGGSVSVGAMSQWYVGAMAEVNLGDVFFIAAGPGIGRFSLAGVTVTANSNEASEQVRAYGGWTPSLDLKLGFTFGRRNPESGRRGGFTLALDLRAVFPLESVYVSVGTNGTQVETRRAGFGLIPMLVLGYDSR